ncbi:hypothetical protein IAU60_006172 [Kwoniella sp. DSM 27419]
MRSPLTFVLLLLGLAVTVLAWTKEDHEIFDLVSALEAAEGKGTDFYNHIGVDPSAGAAEINKAYRKKSMTLHPDKNPGVKNIQERFARLGVIAQILRSPEKRERYNFFHKNGVPRWRGTGYYYSRYRPTLSHTIVFLIALTSGLHYVVLTMNYRKHQRRVDYFVKAARSAAGVLGVTSDATTGEQISVPVQGRRRKVRVPMVEGNDSAGTLELIVSGNEVLLPHDDGSLESLSGLAKPPSATSTWFLSLMASLYGKALAALPPNVATSFPPVLRPRASHELQMMEMDEQDDEDSALDTPTPALRARGKLNGRTRLSRSDTPRDSPATTELESEGDGEGAGSLAGEAKKKRLPGGKAGAARRRKMALKK